MRSVDGDIYPLLAMPAVVVVLAAVVVLLLPLIYVMVVKLRLIRALKKQATLTTAQKVDSGALVASALAELETAFVAAQNNTVAIDEAAQRMSTITRRTFDTIMNHSTLSFSALESLQRNLKTVGGLQQAAYPIEFAESIHTLAELQTLFERSKAVVQACK